MSAARLALTLVLTTALGILAQVPRAQAAIEWRDGLIMETYTLNCLSQETEFGIGVFVGQLYDTTYTQPYVGERFYMRIHVAGLGSSPITSNDFVELRPRAARCSTSTPSCEGDAPINSRQKW